LPLPFPVQVRSRLARGGLAVSAILGRPFPMLITRSRSVAAAVLLPSAIGD
jgi:hypothetical protein